MRRTVEEWGHQKGHLPERTPRQPRAAIVRGQRVLVEQLPVLNPERVKLRVAMARKGWELGTLVTEDEFDAAVAAALRGRI